MIIEVTKSDFMDYFRKIRPDNFSYDALSALYDWLSELEPEYHLDVIALCCDFYEDTIDNILYEHELESLEDLKYETTVIWHDEKSVLYHVF